MGSLFDGVIHWAIRRRVWVLLLAAGLFFGGSFSISRATWDVLPDFMPPRVVVQTETEGMGTLQTEELVTTPLERVLLGTPDVASVRSTSTPGLSVVTLTFDDDIDVYRARQLVAERLDVARGDLPRAARRPEIAPLSAPLGALEKTCISAKPDATAQDLRELRAYGDAVLRPKLLAIAGVAQVTIHGGLVERIEVRPDPGELRRHALSVKDVSSALRGTESGAGFVTQGEARLNVATDTRIRLARVKDDLESLYVGGSSGSAVSLGDVASVVHGESPPVGAALCDGRPGIYLQVNKLPRADTLALTRRVDAILSAARSELPAGAELQEPVYRQADFVRASVWSVARAMLVGGVLVMVVLFAFLRSGRLAAISLTAIPLSIVAALTVLVLRGETINGMTLGGLAIAVGEVVDDAIVDVENVWRRLRENARADAPKSPIEVIRAASVEVRGSVVYASIIVCVVLVPVLLLGGVAGRIFSPLAESYMLAIGASLAVALIVTPAMCAALLPRIATPDAHHSRLAEWLLRGYARLVRRAVARPKLVLAFAGALVVGAAALVPQLGGSFLPELHEGSLIATMHAAPGTSLEATAAIAKAIDAQARPSVASRTAARVGRAELDEDASPIHRVEMDLVVADSDDEWEEIVDRLGARIGGVPGVSFQVEGFLGERVHEVLAGETAPVVVKVTGPDLDRLRSLSAEVTALMAHQPDLGRVRPEPQVDVPELRVLPERGRLLAAGARPDDVAEAVEIWQHGRRESQILESNARLVDVALAGPPWFRERAGLEDIPVSTARGVDVPLGSVAQVDVVPEPSVIQHDGGVRRITIGASPERASLSTASNELEKKLRERIDVPPGYDVEVGGEAVARTEAATQLVLVGLAVLVAIFALLSIAFESGRNAGIVMLNFPLGLVGGVAAATLGAEGLSVSGFIGFVTLFGIIARNGIMLVAHQQHLEVEAPDMALVDRVVRAAEERLLPILMTAATAGLALLPLALSGERAGGELEAPMAVIVCGGLITSTLLNMLVLPTVYVALARRKAHQGTASYVTPR